MIEIIWHTEYQRLEDARLIILLVKRVMTTYIRNLIKSQRKLKNVA